MKIVLKDVVKEFNTFRAVRGVSLEIGSGQLVAWAVGFRQDDDPANGGRPRIS
jgi:ABC-type uncharacterized transport system ATPase subunit